MLAETAARPRSCRPFGAQGIFYGYPGLTPGATSFRSFGPVDFLLETGSLRSSKT